MISLIRKKFGKKAFDFVVWLTVFSLLFGLLISIFFGKFSSGKPAVSIGSVNGQEITPSEFQRKIRSDERMISAIRQQYGKSAPYVLQMYGLTGSAEERAKKAITHEKLLNQTADTIGIVLSPDYVSEKLAEPAFARCYLGEIIPPQLMTPSGINFKELVPALRSQNMTVTCFESIVDEKVKTQILAGLLNASVYVPDAAARLEFDRYYRRKKFSLTKVPLSAFAKKEGSFTDEELKKFAQEQNALSRRYWTSEKRSGTVWTFENVPEGFEKEGDITLRGQGESFNQFVAKYKGVKAPLGPTERKSDTMARKLFEQAIGARSVVRDGKKGYVVETTSINEAKEQPFAAIRTQVLRDYTKKQAAETLSRDLEEIKSLDSKKRAEWAKKHNAVQSTTPYVGLDNAEEMKDFTKEGIGFQQLVSLERAGDMATALGSDYGYLIELLDFEPYDAKAFELKKPELDRVLQSDETNRVIAGFIASLEKNAKIITNKAIFSRQS